MIVVFGMKIVYFLRIYVHFGEATKVIPCCFCFSSIRTQQTVAKRAWVVFLVHAEVVVYPQQRKRDIAVVWVPEQAEGAAIAAMAVIKVATTVALRIVMPNSDMVYFNS